MPSHIGKQGVVVGAGMAGLTAARSLADFFERVTVLENDALPKEAAHRQGTPQSRHLHVLLPGGLRAMSRLFPGFEESLSKAGAVPLRMGYDYRVERPGYDPFPLRDLGILAYCMTRPLLEFTARKRLGEHRNVELRENCRAQEFIPARGDAAVAAVRYESSDGKSQTLSADLVVDASGHGGLTMALLDSIGWPVPEETLIGVDIGYATALFDVPQDAPAEWVSIFTFPNYPRNKRAGVILTVEGNRWMLTLVGRYDEKPPVDWDGFLAFAQQLRTPTIYNAIRRAKRPSSYSSVLKRAGGGISSA